MELLIGVWPLLSFIWLNTKIKPFAGFPFVNSVLTFQYEWLPVFMLMPHKAVYCYFSLSNEDDGI